MTQKIRNILAVGILLSVWVLASMPKPVSATDNYPSKNAVCTYPNDPNYGQIEGTCGNYDWGYFTYDSQGNITGRYVNSSRLYGFRNCTDWVAWRLSELGIGTVPSGWGNATYWDNHATGTYNVDNAPEPGDIAVWEGIYGHVAVVESVNADGTVNISEYNRIGTGLHGTRSSQTAHHYIDLNGIGVGINGEFIVGSGGGGSGSSTHYADYMIYRFDPATSTGYWYAKSSSSGGPTPIWGAAHGSVGDIPVVGDFNGDNYDDYGVFRMENGVGTWYIKSSTTGQPTAIWGATHGSSGDIPVVGDVTGDGIADFGVYRLVNGAGTWYFKSGSDGQPTPIWGAAHGSAGDIPVVGDFNNDDIDDFGIYRMEPDSNGRWYIKSSANGQPTPIWGATHGSPGDIPVVGDFNGDDTDDFGIYRPLDGTGYWYPKSGATGQPITSAWGVTHGGWTQDKALGGDFGAN